MRRALGLLGLAVVVSQASLLARSKKIDAIDSECDGLHDSFREAVPLSFSGPNPWMEMDAPQKADPGYAVALVYAAGPKIRWVVMQLLDDAERWTENVDYCFAEDGSIERRGRQLESRKANVVLEVVTYYEGHKVLKEKTRHRAPDTRREDSSKMEDPGAPLYWTVDDLPFPLPDLWRGVAVRGAAPAWDGRFRAGIPGCNHGAMDLAGWEAKYRSGDRGKEDAPTILVVETAGKLAPGTAIDLACGAGRNALYLAERGWTVTAVDGSRTAIELVDLHAAARGLRVNTTVADLTAPNFSLPRDTFDLVLIAYYLQRNLFTKAKEAVPPGGVIVAIAHTPEPGETWSEKRARPGELREFFDGWELLWEYEGRSRDPAHRRPVAEIVARRIE